MEDRFFDSALQKTVERTQVQRTERIVDVTVVTPHEALTIMSVQKTVEVQQTQFLDRVVDLRILRDPVSGLSKDKFGLIGDLDENPPRSSSSAAPAHFAECFAPAWTGDANP